MSFLFLICILPVLTAQTPASLPPTRKDSPPLMAEDGLAEEPKPQAHDPGGLWPSPRLMELLLSRWADEAADRYGLNDAQEEQIRQGLVERWSELLETNRETFQPLANEFLEMRLALEPPEADQVQAWSDRALPVFQKVRTEIAATQGMFREVLSPLQRAKFEIDALKTAAGLQIAENKLRDWREGRFDPDDVWEPLPSMRKERRRERDPERAGSAQEKAAGEPVDQVAAELSAWDKYVAEFIAEHGLDEGQRTAALSCLKELTERASAHQTVHREQIDSLEKQIASHKGTPEELAEIQRKLVELYGPIDEMFQELKTRIEAIPTAEQRARVAEARARTGNSPAKSDKLP